MKSSSPSSAATQKKPGAKSATTSITLRKTQKRSELLLKKTKKLIEDHPEKTLEVLRKWLKGY
ncbi:MAG: hypothetical protein CMF70_00235 [Magnetovibrio sp.]|nr:hypothetical protein [Magnetovibrio sp.]|tara:strand:+ start:359 stop:547 length:189 start_codon:yes stop_codon:yes gene_type:complete